MANQIARPDADDTDGNWTDKDGGSTLYTSIDDTSTGDDATTFIKVADQSSNESCVVRLEDVDTPASGDAWIKYKALAEDGGMGGIPGLKLELLQGDSVLDPAVTTTNNSVDTGSFTSYSYTISDVSGISDWTDLKLKITMLTNTGAFELMKVTQAYLETQEAGGGSAAKIPVTLFINGMST